MLSIQESIRPKDVRLICRDGMPKWNNHIPFRFLLLYRLAGEKATGRVNGIKAMRWEMMWRMCRCVPSWQHGPNLLTHNFNYEYYAVFPNLFTCFRKEWFCERHLNDNNHIKIRNINEWKLNGSLMMMIRLSTLKKIIDWIWMPSYFSFFRQNSHDAATCFMFYFHSIANV